MCICCMRDWWVALTSAVPEVGVAGRVVLAQPLQDLLVVHEPVQWAQEEGVERQVAHLLQLEVSAQVLQPPRTPDAGLQRLQRLAVLPQVGSQVLAGARQGWAGVLLRRTECARGPRGPLTFGNEDHLHFPSSH